MALTQKFALLVSFITAASAVASAPHASVLTVPVSKKVGAVDTRDLITRENERRVSFASAAASTASVPVTNDDVSYLAATKVNTQTFNLIVDTGSSNTWVGADTKFDSSGATSTLYLTTVSYGSGSFFGTEYETSVSLGSGATVSKMYIGDALYSEGFSGVDGIIGFGPVGLTEDTVLGLSTVPTFTNTLLSEGVISSEVLGVSFAPISSAAASQQNGELTLGGTDSARYTGSITYTPLTTTSPYSEYWGIDVDGIGYDGASIGGAASAIVDTGTTLIYIPEAAYDAFLSATGGTTDSTSGLAEFPTAPTGTFTITVAGTSFSLTPTQYLVPADQYTNFGLTAGKFYAWINDGGSDSTSVDFIIGQKFMENYYAVFDTTASKVGFATSAVTSS